MRFEFGIGKRKAKSNFLKISPASAIEDTPKTVTVDVWDGRKSSYDLDRLIGWLKAYPYEFMLDDIGGELLIYTDRGEDLYLLSLLNTFKWKYKVS